jgi:hypothetical protein
MLLLTLPFLNWFFEHQQRNLQQWIAALLDEVARRLQLVKLEYRSRQNEFVEPATPCATVRRPPAPGTFSPDSIATIRDDLPH